MSEDAADTRPMITMTSPTPLTDRMGIYTTLDEVPDEHRLHQHTERYADTDVWETFLTEHLFERYNSDRFQEEVQRAGRRWKAHMAERGRHHALARPADIETWAQTLLDTLTRKTAYNCYWVRIERFYTWLQWHREYPHTYHPVWMAAANGDATGELWAEKMARGHGDTA